MKKILALSLLLLFITMAFAAEYTIGTGTSTQSYVPFYGLYDYSWSKVIYTKAEINTAGLNAAGNINSIAFYVGNTPANYTMPDQRVYIRHTSLSTYGTATDETGTGFPNNANFAQVFQGDMVFNGGGWREIVFSTPFNWDNTQNIEILWENWNGDYVSGYPTFRYTTAANTSVYKYADNSFPTVVGTRYGNRPNIQFITPTTTPPNAAMIGAPADAATLVLPTATLSWASGGGAPTGYKLYFGTDGAGTSTPTNIVNGTDLGNVLSYDPNPDLTAGTTYYWKVVPYNGIGDATTCPIWSFTTMGEGYTQIGTGTSTQIKPFGTTWGYERSAALYTAAQVGSIGTLDEIAWYCVGTSATAIPYKIYVKSTTDAAMTAMTWPSFVASAQLVKEGTYSFSSSGWKLFTLDSPFPYISGNLIIGVETNYGGSGGGSGHTFHYSTGATGSHQYWNTDSSPSVANGTLNTSLPNVLLHLGELSATPELVVSPTSWDFGQNFLNIPATKQFTISNIGGGTLNLSSVVASGSYYSITVAPTDMALTTGESTTFTVQYLPTAVGASHTGTVTITDGRAVTTINLSGSCVDPTIYHADLPHVENFDTVTVPALPFGWSSINVNADAANWGSYASTPYSAPNSASIGYNGSLALNDWMISPPLSLEVGTTYRVGFQYRGGSTSYVEKLKVMLGTGNQVADMTTQVFINENINFTDYTSANATFTVPSTGTYYLGWHAYSIANQLRMYVDDITISIPDPEPPLPATAAFPLNGMTTLLNPILKWTPSVTGEPATSYKVYLNTTGTFTEADLKYTGTATQYQSTGIANGSTYYWKVLPTNAYGADPTCPTWTFITPGAAQLAEGFEGTTFPPAGWQRTTTSTSYWTYSTTTPYQGTRIMYAYTSTSTPYTISTPLVAVNGTSKLDFFAKATAATQVLQIMQSTDRTTWTQVGSDITCAVSTEWYPISVNLGSLTPGDYYLAFHVPTQSSTGSVYVDHVIGPNIVPVVPSPATQTAPADAAINQGIRPTLTWTTPTTGGVPTGFKILCDTDNPPTTLVDTATASPYTFAANLDWGRTYYWSVVPTNLAGDASPNTIRSFTVMDDPTIYVTPTTPYLQPFATVPPAGWSRYTGLYDTALTTTTSGWATDDFCNLVTTPTNPSARLNVYGASTKYWIVTPPISIPATGYQMKMDIGLTTYSGIQIAPTPGAQADDKFIVVISDSPNMTDPTILREWNNTDSPYVYDEISSTGESQSIDLSAYAGTKYIAFYGESTLTGGDNNIYVDNVLIRQTPAGAPEAVTLHSPADEAENLPIDGFNLTWTPSMTGGDPETYAVFMSQNAADPTDDRYWDGITMTSFDPTQADDPLTFSYGETWYWTVMASNADGDAETPAAFSFTIMDDPRIISLPYSQNFDGVATPNFPAHWIGYKSNSSSSLYTSTTYAQSTPNSVYMYSYTTTETMQLISPEVTVPMNSFKVSFWARGGSAGAPLKIGTVSAVDGTGTFTELASLTLTATFAQYAVSFDSYAGTDQYICFQHGTGSTYQSLYLDTVLIEELMANDMAATLVAGPAIGVAGEQLTYNVTVMNNGTAPQASYNVYIKKFGAERLATLAVSTPLAAGASVVHTLNWTPATAGVFSIVGEVELTGDMYAGNNESAAISANIYAAGTYMPMVGDITSTTSTNSYPINVFYKNNMCETIYLGHEMQATSGTINAIILQNNFTQNVTKPIKLWMKHTTEANLSSAYLPFAGYQLVFEGNVYFPMGVNAVVINLSTPFVYTGGNLAVRTYAEWESAYSASSNYFYYTPSSQYPSRTRYYQADGDGAFDPTTLLGFTGSAFTGTLVSNIPNTAFVMSPATPITALATPVATVVKTGTNAVLNWTAIPGAFAYRVYASDDPYTFSDTILATVYTNTYNSGLGTSPKKFYKVVAISYHHTDRDLVLNPAAAIGFDNSAVKLMPYIPETKNKD